MNSCNSVPAIHVIFWGLVTGTLISQQVRQGRSGTCDNQHEHFPFTCLKLTMKECTYVQKSFPSYTSRKRIFSTDTAHTMTRKSIVDNVIFITKASLLGLLYPSCCVVKVVHLGVMARRCCFSSSMLLGLCCRCGVLGHSNDAQSSFKFILLRGLMFSQQENGASGNSEEPPQRHTRIMGRSRQRVNIFVFFFSPLLLLPPSGPPPLLQ